MWATNLQLVSDRKKLSVRKEVMATAQALDFVHDKMAYNMYPMSSQSLSDVPPRF